MRQIFQRKRSERRKREACARVKWKIRRNVAEEKRVKKRGLEWKRKETKKKKWNKAYGNNFRRDNTVIGPHQCTIITMLLLKLKFYDLKIPKWYSRFPSLTQIFWVLSDENNSKTAPNNHFFCGSHMFWIFGNKIELYNSVFTNLDII